MRKCPRCKLSKPEGDFGFKNKQTGQRVAYCRPCVRSYNKEHYQGDKQQYFKRNRKATSKKRDFLAELKDKPCTDCGGKFHPCAMDFDHLDSSNKELTIGFDYRRVSRKRLESELAKCELVCANCHRVRTWKRANMPL